VPELVAFSSELSSWTRLQLTNARTRITNMILMRSFTALGEICLPS
jgi:hypothetical protein